MSRSTANEREIGLSGVLERICSENPVLCYDALVAREENILRFRELF